MNCAPQSVSIVSAILFTGYVDHIFPKSTWGMRYVVALVHLRPGSCSLAHASEDVWNVLQRKTKMNVSYWESTGSPSLFQSVFIRLVPNEHGPVRHGYRGTWEELIGRGRDLGLLGDAVGVVSGTGAPGGAEAWDLPHPLGERGQLQHPQHIHWIWGETASGRELIHLKTAWSYGREPWLHLRGWTPSWYTVVLTLKPIDRNHLTDHNSLCIGLGLRPTTMGNNHSS